MKQNSGMALHLKHNGLFEWCWDLKRRIKVINTEKPKDERAIRKRLLRLLTKEEVAMLPKDFVEMCRIEGEADKKRKETRRKWRESGKNWKEVEQRLIELEYKRMEEDKKYNPQLEKIHKKICNCKEWNGEEIIFG